MIPRRKESVGKLQGEETASAIYTWIQEKNGGRACIPVPSGRLQTVGGSSGEGWNLPEIVALRQGRNGYVGGMT